MFKQLIYVAILSISLSGCGGSHVTATSSINYKSGDLDLTVSKTVTVKGNKDTTEPPEVDIPPITLSPYVISNKVETETITSLDGSTIVRESTTPIIGADLNDKGISGKGPSLSNFEASLPLLKYPMIIGAIILSGGIILFFVPLPVPILKKISVGIAISGIVLMASSWILSQISWAIWLIGGIILLGTIGLVLYILYGQGKALKESINTVEFIKKKLSPDQKKDLFDNEMSPIVMMQSPSTRNLVKEIRIKEGFKKK